MDLKFEKVINLEGPNQSIVTDILKDSRGFIWLATFNGLTRYDGYSYKVYYPESDNPNSISDITIRKIYEDPQYPGKVLWISTDNGLNKFDIENEIFTQYKHNPQNPNSIGNNLVTALHKDSIGNLWIGTIGGGLNLLKTDTNTFIKYTHNPLVTNSISSDWVQSIFQDGFGILWLGTSGALNRFDPHQNIFTEFRPDKKDINSIGLHYIPDLAEDDEGNLWLCTADGLIKVILTAERSNISTLKRYHHDPEDNKSIGGNWVENIKIDKDGRLVLGLWGAGIDIFDRNSEIFYHYKNKDIKDIMSLCLDRQQEIIWIGGSNGLYKAFEPNKKFQTIKNHPEDNNSLNNNHITNIYEDRKGVIWISTITGGLNKFDRRSQKFTHYTHDPGNPESLPSNQIFTIIEDSLNNLWIATSSGLTYFNTHKEIFTTFSPGLLEAASPDPINPGEILWLGGAVSGVFEFHIDNHEYDHYEYKEGNSNSLSDNSINYLFSEIYNSVPVVWIGTEFGGLNKFNLSTKKFTHFQHDINKIGSISNDAILAIFRDTSGTLWIGTRGGLNSFNEEDQSFTCYRKQDGLPSDIITGILEDKNGNLWLGTMNGISKFNPNTIKFNNFNTENGLPSNEYYWPAFALSHTGEFLFGSNNGICIFHPDSIKYNSYIAPVYLTDFQLFHKSVSPGIDSPLKKSIMFAEEIILKYYQNVFSFEFTALNYINPMKNMFAYKMEGFDPDWVYTDALNRRANYTNLDPGEYIFRLRASNDDGYWNEEGTSIKVIILPPWWQTNWAYAGYILIISLVLAGIWTVQVRRLRTRHQLEMKNLQAEKLLEMDRVKSRFFANISHEFRTPLTLILGPVQKILHTTREDSTRKELTIMQRSAKRLSSLIEQLLDLSRLEAGHMKMKARKINIVDALKPMILSYASLAEKRKIKLSYSPANKIIMCWIDYEILEKIVTNLLSNAFKFTPDGGKISVTLEVSKRLMKERFKKPVECIEISVRDTGPGIPDDKLDRIFDRFYQVDGSGSGHYEGTGIGLALTKELVERHYGEIRVQSELNKGSTFTISLPMGRGYLKEEEIDEAQEIPEVLKKTEESLAEKVDETESIEMIQSSKAGQKLPLLLIVEDHADMRQYMKGYLENNYRIIEAVNGIEGIHQSIKYLPDLIISDVMMPKMDGYELCKMLKTDERTSHIPVILLTARADIESRLEGLEFGADDYVTKPFDARELQVRSRNLLEQRRQLKEKFSKTFTVEPHEIACSSFDEKFLRRASEIIENEISNPEFDVEKFSKEIGMSRANLYRKLQALTGQSAKEFIQTIRLKRAAQLLQKHAGNITEIAYEVGFKSPPYFTKCFRNQFGITPSKFVANN